YSPNNEIIISIPAGNWASEPFRIPLETIADGELEQEEQLQLSLEDRPGIYRLSSTTACGGAPIETLTYTILDKAVTFDKTGTFVDVAGGVAADGQAIRNAGDRMDYTFTLTNNGGA